MGGCLWTGERVRPEPQCSVSGSTIFTHILNLHGAYGLQPLRHHPDVLWSGGQALILIALHVTEDTHMVH